MLANRVSSSFTVARMPGSPANSTATRYLRSLMPYPSLRQHVVTSSIARQTADVGHATSLSINDLRTAELGSQRDPLARGAAVPKDPPAAFYGSSDGQTHPDGNVRESLVASTARPPYLRFSENHRQPVDAARYIARSTIVTVGGDAVNNQVLSCAAAMPVVVGAIPVAAPPLATRGTAQPAPISGATLRQVATIDLPGPPGRRFDYLTTDDEGKQLFSAHLAAGLLYVIDLRNNTVIATVSDVPGVEGVAYIDEGRKVYTSNWHENKIGVVDL